MPDAWTAAWHGTLVVRPTGNGNGVGDGKELKKAWKECETSGREFQEQMDELVEMLDGVVGAEESSEG